MHMSTSSFSSNMKAEAGEERLCLDMGVAFNLLNFFPFFHFWILASDHYENKIIEIKQLERVIHLRNKLKKKIPLSTFWLR